MLRKLATGGGLLLAAFAITFAAVRHRPAAAATQSVTISDDQFVDATSGNSTTTISAGDTVTWTWTGANPHSVTSDTGLFDEPSGDAKDAGSFSFQFDTPGTYAYHCRVHGAPGGVGMSGAIVVQAAATNTPAPTNTAASSSTPQPSSTSASATDTPAASATSSNATAAPTTAAAAASPTAARMIPSGAPGGAATLPRTGTGAGERSGRALPPVLLALGGLAVVTVAGMIRLRRRRA